MRRTKIFVILIASLIICLFIVTIIVKLSKNKNTRLVLVDANTVEMITLSRTWSSELPTYTTEDRGQIEQLVNSWNELQVMTGYDELIVDRNTAIIGGNYDLTLVFKDGNRVNYSFAPFDHIVSLKPISEDMMDEILRKGRASGDYLGLIQKTEMEKDYIRKLHEVSGWQDNP